MDEPATCADEQSEDVADGMRLLDEQKAMIDTLRAALIEGEESGNSAPFDFDAFFAGKRDANTGLPPLP